MGSQILAWIAVGLIAALLVKVLIPEDDEERAGLFDSLVLGIVGAVVGGWIWLLLLNEPGITGIDFGSLLIAFVGAVIVICLLRMFTRPTTAY